MNTPPKSANLNVAQLEIPFAQPEIQSIQPETQSITQAPQPSLKEVDLALGDQAMKAQTPEESQQKAKKKKADRVKAAFNLMDYIVKYYNTGETYISRAFTLVGMASLIVLGANRLTTMEGGLSNFVPPLDIFPTLLNNLQAASSNVSSDSPQAPKATPMTSSFEQVTRLQPALVSPSFTTENQLPSEVAPASESVSAPESAPTSVSEPVAPSTPQSVENAPWVSPTPVPEVPSVSLPLPEVTSPLPSTVQETITEVQQGVQQAAGQLNQSMPLPEIVSPQPADLGTKIPEVQQGVQQAAEQLGQVASPSIPIGVDSLPSVPNVPSVPDVPAGLGGIF